LADPWREKKFVGWGSSRQMAAKPARTARGGRTDGRTDGRTGRTPLAGRRGSGAGGEGEGRTCSSVTFTDDISLKREIKD